MDASHGLRIGEVARAAGVNIQTLRYYERRRLLRPVSRALNGYRCYDAESVRLLRFVKHAQGLGFSLREVQALLRLRETRGVPCAQVRERAERKIAEIIAKERQLGRHAPRAGETRRLVPHGTKPAGVPHP